MILTRYDAAFHIQCEKEESFKEGEQAGFQRGIEEGIQRGIETGIQQGIFAMIGDNLEEHVSTERILQKLHKHYHLTLEEAQAWMANYEKEKCSLL